MKVLLGFALVASVTTGCALTPPPQTDDGNDPFVHRTYTAWQPLPSKDGSRLALALEPRRVDADQHGVMVSGWHGKVAGDGVVAIASDAEHPVVTTVPRGFHLSDWDDDTLFVWTSAASTWTPEAPNDMPPPAPYASVTWLDRDSFAPKGTRTFDPPLEMPIAVGGALVLDVPAPGKSDVARDLRVALVDLESGRTEELLRDRGFAVAICARGLAATVAYQRTTAATTIIDVVVEGGHARVARLDRDDFLADGVTCRAGGRHAAVIGGRPSDREGRALVLERGDDAISVAFENSVGLPAALSRDGATLLATGPDGGAMLVTKTGARPLSGVRGSGSVVVSGDRALLAGDDDAFVVRLDGTTPATTKVPFTVAKSEHAAFATGGGGFLVFETTYDDARYGEAVARAFILGDDGASELTLPAYDDPYVAFADERSAWLVGDRGEAGVDLVAIDLVDKRVKQTLPFPLCDRAAMQTKERCFP